MLAYHWSLKMYTCGYLVCVLAYHWSFVLYDVIFYRHYKELRKQINKMLDFQYGFQTAGLELVLCYTKYLIDSYYRQFFTNNKIISVLLARASGKVSII